MEEETPTYSQEQMEEDSTIKEDNKIKGDSTISNGGVLRIPKSILEHLNIAAGDKITYQIIKNSKKPRSRN